MELVRSVGALKARRAALRTALRFRLLSQPPIRLACSLEPAQPLRRLHALPPRRRCRTLRPQRATRRRRERRARARRQRSGTHNW